MMIQPGHIGVLLTARMNACDDRVAQVPLHDFARVKVTLTDINAVLVDGVDGRQVGKRAIAHLPEE